MRHLSNGATPATNGPAGFGSRRSKPNTPVFTDDRPEMMQCIGEIRNVIDAYPGRPLCGEVQGKIDRIGNSTEIIVRACICR